MIAILGCGITGMMTALAFANNGIKTSIIERSIGEKFPPDMRTTTFTNTAKNFMEKAEIWPLLEKESGYIKDIYIVDNKSPKMLHLDSEEGQYKGYVLPNIFIKETLYEAVKSHPLIELKKGVDYGMPYEAGGKVVIPSKEDIEVDILLVCDGRGSILKEMFPARIDKSYGQSGIVLVAHHELNHEGCAVEHFMSPGPFATLPMKDPNLSSIVWTESNEVANAYINLPREELETHLQERMGEFLGKVKIIGDVQAFPLIARVTKQYYKGNIVLVGDAAHALHPLAGQGLNQGIKDIDSIVSIITQRLKLGLEIDAIAFEEYEKSRSMDNFSMYLITDNLNRIFSNNIFPLASLRKVGLSIINELDGLKRMLSIRGSGG